MKAILDALKNPSGVSIGYFSVTVDDAPAVVLPSIPASAVTAMVIIEADAAAATPTRVVRFREDGGLPTSLIGRPAGNDTVYEVVGRTNINNFRIIGITGGETHTIHVEYFGR